MDRIATFMLVVPKRTLIHHPLFECTWDQMKQMAEVNLIISEECALLILCDYWEIWNECNTGSMARGIDQ
jgi:hypothetical protein